jgi:hypothetical protein
MDQMRATNAALANGARIAARSAINGINVMRAWTNAQMSAALDKSLWAATDAMQMGSNMMARLTAAGTKELKLFGEILWESGVRMAYGIVNYTLSHPVTTIQVTTQVAGKLAGEDGLPPKEPAEWVTYWALDVADYVVETLFGD